MTHRFTVPEIDGQRSEKPLDLGPLTVNVTPIIKAGTTAPEFDVKTLDGKPLKLADFRGKFVLLDFWAVWCEPCIKDIPHLKDVYNTFGKDKRLVIISLSLDEKPDAPKKFAAKHELEWFQACIGKNSPLADTYSVKGIPAVFLIAPTGKVLAKDLRGPAIKNAVEKALGQAI